MTNKAKNVRFVELAGYTRPKITEQKNKDYVSIGEDNDYFNYLIENYNGSPTNNAIINGIAEQIYGSGLDARDKSNKPDQWAMLKTMVSAECLRNIILDFKICGQFAFQVIYKPGKESIARLEHYPVDTLRPEKDNENGEIKKYYYHPDWDKVKPREDLDFFPAFGHGSKTELNEIMYVKPYRTGYFYFAPVDYQGCLPYCELEQEVANYHINNVRNGMAPSMLINFNNGQPDDKDQAAIERSIASKYSGSSNAGKFILAFNDNKDAAATIEAVQLSDAHNQYEFLSQEASQKIMVGHRVTSPMLLGIKDQTGLGNNADELKTASMLFEATTINPFRLLIIDAIEKAMAFNKMSLNVFFRSLNPFEQEASSEESQSEVTLSKDDRPFLKDEKAQRIVEQLEGIGESEEELLSDWELIDTDLADDEPEDFDAESYINSREDFAAQDQSAQDTEFYKVRYTYEKGTRKEPKGGHRPLCAALLSANKVYRKEDILKLSSNGGAEDGGQRYSVWLYKGGVNCYHRWERRVYRKRRKNNGEPWGGGTLSGTRRISVNQAIRQGFRPEKNAPVVAKAPIDLPDNGRK